MVNSQIFEHVHYGLVLELEICILHLHFSDTFSTYIMDLEIIKYDEASCFHIPRLFLHRLQISSREMKCAGWSVLCLDCIYGGA